MGVLRPNPNLYIPVEFVDSDGTVHTARDWDELVAKVTGYRERRNLPSGNPRQEVLDQACSQYPDRCIDTERRVVPEARPGLNNRILAWVGELVGKISRIGFVSSAEAERRAAICASCPMQKVWGNSCAACRTQINRVAKELLDGRPLNDQMRELQGCDALGEDTRVSIWVNQPGVGGGVPENCWRK